MKIASYAFSLIILAFIGLVISAMLSPEQQAKAEIAIMNAQRADQAAAIQQQYAQARANIEAEALARLELEKRQSIQQQELEKAHAQIEFEKQQQLDKLRLEFEREMSVIQRDIDTTRATALMQVIIYLSVGLGGSMLAILLGRGIGNGLTALARNRGEVVRPDPQTGQFPAIVRADAVYLPGRMTGAYMVIRRPSAAEKIIVAIGTAVALMRGKPVQQADSPWVQMETPSDAQLQVTGRDQTHGLLTAATRAGANQHIADQAVKTVFNSPAVDHLLASGRMPLHPIMITVPDRIQRFEQSINHGDDE